MWDWINEKIERFEQKVLFEPGNQFVEEKVTVYLSGVKERFADWTIEVLPDLMGYGTMAAGVMVIIGSVIDKGGMMKPLGYLACGGILSICILISAKG